VPSTELLSHIKEALLENPHTRQYKLSVHTEGGSIIMTGTVRCYYHKQMANEAVRKVLVNTSTTHILFKNHIDVVQEK